MGITDAKIVGAAENYGLTCQTDSYGVTCDGTTALGTDLSAFSTDNDEGVEQVVVTGLGDATEARQFLTHMSNALLGSRGPAVVSWFKAHQNDSVVEKTFGPYDVTYRGPMENAELDIAPA